MPPITPPPSFPTSPVLMFPDGYPVEECLSKGRNGPMKTSGVQLYLGYPHTIDINPITSQGLVSGACRLSLAKDKAFLKAFAAEIDKFADTL
jgi:hypothetical protein